MRRSGVLGMAYSSGSLFAREMPFEMRDLRNPVTIVVKKARLGTPSGEQDRRVPIMPTWLIILLVGVVLLVLGVAVEAAQFLIWLGVIVLVVSLIMGLVGRGKARV